MKAANMEVIICRRQSNTPTQTISPRAWIGNDFTENNENITKAKSTKAIQKGSKTKMLALWCGTAGLSLFTAGFHFYPQA